jgi:hypothetical protein
MSDHTFETIKSCRACNSDGLVDILYLGEHPLANSLVDQQNNKVRRFPLSTVFCPECSLFQIKETIPKEVLFDHYVWVTGTSKGAREYAAVFAKRVIKKANLKPGDLILEIASNDGTILKQFIENNMEVLGIEPAKNIAEIAVNKGIRTESNYWDATVAKNIINRYGKPRAVIARNVIPHVSELHDVIEGIALVLADDGTGVIEFHSGKIIVNELQYDSIYHEHLCYFTVNSLSRLLERYGLFPWGIDGSPISGGSIVLYFSKERSKPEVEYITLSNEEKDSGVTNQAAWERFGLEAKLHREKTLALLKGIAGKKIVGFGASARSATFMNFCGIGRNYIQAIIDNNPIKQGKMTPAGDVPIVSFDQGMDLKPDIIFVLAWNFKEEIIEQCKKYGFNGSYILPFPQYPQIVSGE